MAQSSFYRALTFYARGRPVPGLFATRDEDVHRALKRPVANLFSTSNVVTFEKFVDSTIQEFFDQIDTRFVKANQVCDFGAWLHYFTFDVIAELTFSKRLGFLERGEDVRGIMSSIWTFFETQSPVSSQPHAHLPCNMLISTRDISNAVARLFVGQESNTTALEENQA